MPKTGLIGIKPRSGQGYVPLGALGANPFHCLSHRLGSPTFLSSWPPITPKPASVIPSPALALLPLSFLVRTLHGTTLWGTPHW